MTFIRSIAAAAATVLLAALCATGARADGTLTKVQTFTNAGATLAVYTYTDGDSTVALLGITSSAGVKDSFAIDKANLAATQAGWNKARALPTTPAAAAATIAEDGTTAQDVLLLAGGPGVRFSIADPVNGIEVFTLPPAQYDAFDAALTLAAGKITV